MSITCMSITYIPVTCTRLLRFATPFKVRAIIFVPYIDLPLRDILNYFSPGILPRCVYVKHILAILVDFQYPAQGMLQVHGFYSNYYICIEAKY